MLSTKNILPNFLKTLVIASAATLSISAFAGDVQTQEIKDLKDLNVEESTTLDTKAEMPLIEGHNLTAEEAETQSKTEMEEELRKAAQ